MYINPGKMQCIIDILDIYTNRWKFLFMCGSASLLAMAKEYTARRGLKENYMADLNAPEAQILYFCIISWDINLKTTKNTHKKENLFLKRARGGRFADR